jgi:hypothetical protein
MNTACHLLQLMIGLNKIKRNSMKLSNVSHSQLSIVRYYGACIINGKEYVYNSVMDELDLKVKAKKTKKKEYICTQTKISYE